MKTPEEIILEDLASMSDEALAAASLSLDNSLKETMPEVERVALRKLLGVVLKVIEGRGN